MKLKFSSLLLAVVSAVLLLLPVSAQANSAQVSSAPAAPAAAQAPAVSAGTFGMWSTHGQADCPRGYFCVWRTTNFHAGPMMAYYQCQRYQLGWHTVGSWWNNQIGQDAYAIFYDQAGRVWGRTGTPGSQYPVADFGPIYSLKNCDNP